MLKVPPINYHRNIIVPIGGTGENIYEENDFPDRCIQSYLEDLCPDDVLLVVRSLGNYEYSLTRISDVEDISNLHKFGYPIRQIWLVTKEDYISLLKKIVEGEEALVGSDQEVDPHKGISNVKGLSDYDKRILKGSIKELEE